jgi:hypothetical protein
VGGEKRRPQVHSKHAVIIITVETVYIHTRLQTPCQPWWFDICLEHMLVC